MRSTFKGKKWKNTKETQLVLFPPLSFSIPCDQKAAWKTVHTKMRYEH